MSKHIALLGNPASGKTNFIACSLAYILLRYNVQLLGRNQFFDHFIDSVDEKLPKGQWLEKTKDLNTFVFELKKQKNKYSSTKFTVNDWMGEAFDALNCQNYIQSNSLNKTRQKNLDYYHKTFPEICAQWEKSTRPSLLAPFLDDISSKADIIVIFIDSVSLFFDDQKKKIRASLAALKSILQHDKRWFSKPKFAFVITKADMIETVEKFMTKNEQYCKLFDPQKVQSHLEKEYNTFFSFLKAKNYVYNVWPVSCIPNRAHRKNSTCDSIVPNEEWSVDDMGYSQGVSRATALYSWIGEQLL